MERAAPNAGRFRRGILGGGGGGRGGVQSADGIARHVTLAPRNRAADAGGCFVGPVSSPSSRFVLSLSLSLSLWRRRRRLTSFLPGNGATGKSAVLDVVVVLETGESVVTGNKRSFCCCCCVRFLIWAARLASFFARASLSRRRLRFPSR